MPKYDFSGWATKNDLKCSDGRTIRRDAFKHNDGQTVPLVWNHQHSDPLNVLGHALLENRKDGVYAYCTFNDTPAGKNAKMLVEHGDVSALSIYANQLQQNNGDVTHGVIREVSLVLAGANPGAFIDSIIRHGESSDDEAVIYTGEDIELMHADNAPEKEEGKMDDKNEKTVQDVVDSMTEEQRNVMYALIGQALEDAKHSGMDEEDQNQENNKKGEDEKMKHNVFENDNNKQNNTLTHADMEMILKDAKRCGSLKEAVLAHAASAGDAVYDKYGIKPNENDEGISMLYPDYKNLNNVPEFIKRDTGWVAQVMSGVHHTPFSRIKSMFADITEDEARARGYIKGKLKKEEVFTLLKRTTDPQTIYKKQKLHRDDIIDITSFDVVAWIKAEMRMMLEEEIARAILVGDGRSTSDDDHIQENHIRPIYKEEELFVVNRVLDHQADVDSRAKLFIRTAIKARKDYKGSGEPTLFCTEDLLTDMLLLEDANGRIIYDSVAKLATALRVKNIVTVPVMEGVNRTNGTSGKCDLLGIIVNLKDYNVGADKGGAVNMFEDFDIDYNAHKYLIETRCSGALIKPFSAIVIEEKQAAAAGGQGTGQGK